MVNAVGGISVLDSLAAITRVDVRGGALSATGKAGKAERTQPADRVEISDAAAEAAHGADASAEPIESTHTTGKPAPEGGAAPLSEAEQKQVDELKTRDRVVRLHEQAHRAAAGSLAGPISYSYTTGPDGRRYATEGSVPIDISPVPGDPEATVRKMARVKQAALAPAEPSSADRQIASRASQQAAQARVEQRSVDETDPAAGSGDTADVDETGGLPETGTPGDPTPVNAPGPTPPAVTATNPQPTPALVDVYA
ncbi:MAG: hypothetical protein HKO59_17845 [Phycisphaerales bacterium]|nr:hypothetical protein [Phycisphaerae bacterium]NNF44619.1 hypothetical protein [Phycisphaerales bacterium]NNM27804.1 hypothetical protein [Phycisphaerales bacterium]